MWQRIAIASPPESAISRATASRPSGLRAASASRAPAPAKLRAIARPMPWLAPVTIATWPSSSLSIGLPILRPAALRLTREFVGRVLDGVGDLVDHRAIGNQS